MKFLIKRIHSAFHCWKLYVLVKKLVMELFLKISFNSRFEYNAMVEVIVPRFLTSEGSLGESYYGLMGLLFMKIQFQDYKTVLLSVPYNFLFYFLKI